jgi:hypothetical protein
MTTHEAIIDDKGRVSLREAVQLPSGRRALVTVLDEPASAEQAGSGIECALMSEAALAEDWLRPEEDEAWAYLDDLPNLDDEDEPKEAE